MKHIYLMLTVMLGIAGPSFAQTSFSASLTGNPVNTTGWNYSTVSSVSGNTFVLTQPTTSQAGYIYYNTPVNLASCGVFTVSFEYRVSNSSNPPADGITFWYISNPPTGFTGGNVMGMPANPNGLVLIFDTYDNNSTPDNPLITLRGFNGTQNYVEGNATGQLGNVINNQSYVVDGNWHTATLNYNNGNITVTSDGNTIITANYPLSINGYFGFSAGTGALYSMHALRNVTITGTIPPAPAGIAASTITYCQYDTPAPLSATGTNLKWYTSLSSITPLPGAPTPNTQVPGQTTWYVAQGGSAGCDGPRSPITVIVYAKPPVPVVSSPTHYCLTDIVQPWQISGQNIKWYTSATGGTYTTTLPGISSDTPSNRTWYISQTVNGCESDRVMVNLTVAPKPAPPFVTTPLIYCMGDAAQSLNASGQNILWYTSPYGGGATAVPPVPSTANEDTLTWWVSQTVGNCESIRTKLDVQVRYKPNGVITAALPSLCQGETDTFFYFGNAKANAQYDWKSPFLSTAVLGGGGQGPYIVRFDSAGVSRVRLQVNNNGCVGPEMLYNVTVRPTPVVSVTMKSDACVNEAVDIGLNFSTHSINTYSWDFDGGTKVYGTFTGGPYGYSWNTEGPHVVSVTATASDCPSKTVRDTVNIHGLPDARIVDASTNDICSGDTVVFRANFTDGNTYRWSPVTFFSTTTNDGLYYNDVRGHVEYSGYVHLNVTSKYGCRAADSIAINTHPCCEVYFPNAFSPNGDGRNDRFRVITRGHHHIYNFRVMNRWGQTVFETHNESNGWDGTYNGVPQPMDTYFYYIKYQCNDKQDLDQKGEVLLMR